MDYEAEAVNDIHAADKQSMDDGQYFLLRSIAKSLLALGERLNSIDDALRNTIGGIPR
jgi:hypothetical protein